MDRGKAPRDLAFLLVYEIRGLLPDRIPISIEERDRVTQLSQARFDDLSVADDDDRHF